MKKSNKQLVLDYLKENKYDRKRLKIILKNSKREEKETYLELVQNIIDTTGYTNKDNIRRYVRAFIKLVVTDTSKTTKKTDTEIIQDLNKNSNNLIQFDNNEINILKEIIKNYKEKKVIINNNSVIIGERKRFSFYLQKENAERFLNLAKDKGLNKSKLIDQIIQSYLNSNKQ